MDARIDRQIHKHIDKSMYSHIDRHINRHIDKSMYSQIDSQIDRHLDKLMYSQKIYAAFENPKTIVTSKLNYIIKIIFMLTY